MNTFLPLITLASDLMIHLPFISSCLHSTVPKYFYSFTSLLNKYKFSTAARLAIAQGISLSVSTGPGAPGTEAENSQEGTTTKVNGDDSASPDDKQTSMEVDNDDSKVC